MSIPTGYLTDLIKSLLLDRIIGYKKNVIKTIIDVEAKGSSNIIARSNENKINIKEMNEDGFSPKCLEKV